MNSFHIILENIDEICYIINIKNRKKVNTIKKIIEIFCSFYVCLFLNLCVTQNISAEEIENLTILGDSISTGYGLSEDELSYEKYLQKYFNCNSQNFAVNGQTTDDLLNYIEDNNVSESLENADLICISIGGNDLFQIFKSALSDNKTNLIAEDGNLNISSDFIKTFISDYSIEFNSASLKAAENIEKIKIKIEQINPDAEIIMLTVYNPFECSDSEANNILMPLKKYSSGYLKVINDSIKNHIDKTADIFLKFSEKSYLYTNMDKYDIHPNAIGHMLIAEEIIQIMSENGDFTAFSNAVYNIPQGVFSNFPEYTANELNSFAEGNLRKDTLEQSINAKSESENPEISIEDENNAGEKSKEKNETSKFKKTLSKVFLIAGISLILAVSLRRYIRKRQ